MESLLRGANLRRKGDSVHFRVERDLPEIMDYRQPDDESPATMYDVLFPASMFALIQVHRTSSDSLRTVVKWKDQSGRWSMTSAARTAIVGPRERATTGAVRLPVVASWPELCPGRFAATG